MSPGSPELDRRLFFVSVACWGQVVCKVLRFERVIQQDGIGGVRIVVRFLLVPDIGFWMVCRWLCGRFWVFSREKPSLLGRSKEVSCG